MKIADAESIKAGEQELINGIMEELNSEIIESIASGKLSVKNLEFRNGDMVIHGDRIVYKMEFETSVSLTVMFDRDGNLVSDNDDGLSDTIHSASEEPVELMDEDNDELPDFVSADTTVDDIMAELNPDTQSDQGDDINSILEKNRSFWMAQTTEALEPVDTTDVQAGDDGFQDVLKKNRNFWVEQADSITSGE